MKREQGVGELSIASERGSSGEQHRRSETRASGTPITVREVARLAGVSPSTVSRVLNNYVDLRPETRRRVLEAARKLGYQPNHVARSMVLKRTFTLGLVVSDLANPFYGETARIITQTAHQLNYEVIVCNTEDDLMLLRRSVDALRSRRVDGIICGSAFLHDPVFGQLVDSRFPCMFYNRKIDHEKSHYIVLDNEAAGMEATKHLISLRHRRIAFVAGHSGTSTAMDRQRGYTRALREHGLPVDPAYIRYGGYDQLRASVVVQELLTAPNRPTGIVCANDVMALGALDGALMVGLRVPEDVSIVGFDDIEVAGHRRVSLTTVAQNKVEMSRLAVEKLVEVIEGRIDHPLRITLRPHLLVRSTSDRAPDLGDG